MQSLEFFISTILEQSVIQNKTNNFNINNVEFENNVEPNEIIDRIILDKVDSSDSNTNNLSNEVDLQSYAINSDI